MRSAGGLAVALHLLAMVSAPGLARGEEVGAAVRPDRPLGIITLGPWRALFLDLPLADARPGAEPGLVVRWYMANSWSMPTVLHQGARSVEVQQDEQADALEVTWRVGWARVLGDGPVTRRLTTTAAWRLTEHWGGWSDPLIEEWHELGRYNDFERPDYPRNAIRLTLREPGGVPAVALTRPRLAVGDPVLRTSFLLYEGETARGPWAATARLDLKLPVGRLSDAGGSGGFDAGLALAASAPLTGWLTGHLQLTASRLSSLEVGLPLQPRRWQWGAELSLAAQLPWGWVLLAETRYQSTLFAGRWTLGSAPPNQADAVTAITRPQNQLTFGLRKGAVTFWFSEDFTPGRRPEVGWVWFYNSNAPDIALGVAVALP